MNKLLAKMLRPLARWVINRNDPKVIAVTGSVGKTSTKDIIFDVLWAQYGNMVWKTHGNLNTEIGVPMTILKYKKTPNGFGWIAVIFGMYFRALYFVLSKNYPKILLLEYGADKPGDIQYLTQIAQPDIAIVTEVGPAHLEQFKNIENVAKEKMIIASSLKADGLAILNEDNQYIKERAKKIFRDIRWYHGESLDSQEIIARIVAEQLKIPLKKINEVLDNKKSVKGRLNLLDGINDSVVLDDTYNANPLSVERAYKKIKIIKKENKKIQRVIIVLGDMLELGDESAMLHTKIAKNAKKISKNVVLVGNRFKEQSGVVWFLNPDEAGDYVQKNIKPGDLILVKGSQGMRMEKVVEKIIKHRDNMEELLVRQSKSWKAKPFSQP